MVGCTGGLKATNSKIGIILICTARPESPLNSSPASWHIRTFPEPDYSSSFPEPELGFSSHVPEHAFTFHGPEHRCTFPAPANGCTIPAPEHSCTCPAPNESFTIPSPEHGCTVPAHYCCTVYSRTSTTILSQTGFYFIQNYNSQRWLKGIYNKPMRNVYCAVHVSK